MRDKRSKIWSFNTLRTPLSQPIEHVVVAVFVVLPAHTQESMSVLTELSELAVPSAFPPGRRVDHEIDHRHQA